uniref:NADH dehydrogenase subunit 6 n=1 Tax=Chrysemys dorsalis TaxID=573969 RepID=UPI00286AC0C0|nr:NADH dehydrogenase subunit 6 [Chrysemys dorsalis]WLN41543.1 NADH dehydrogenase subunit 6 [Chrysemys dorsalis]
MMYFMFLFGFCFVFWMVGVSCNPSPYYGVLSLVLGAASGCGVLVGMGGSFMSLVLFLIYLGGMLVVFAYSSALVADPYPAGWGGLGGLVYVVGFVLLVLGLVVMGSFLCSVEGFGEVTADGVGLCVVRLDFGGVSWFYYYGSVMFLISGWGLLLTLFVVLEMVRGLSCGTLHSI